MGRRKKFNENVQKKRTMTAESNNNNNNHVPNESDDTEQLQQQQQSKLLSKWKSKIFFPNSTTMSLLSSSPSSSFSFPKFNMTSSTSSLLLFPPKIIMNMTTNMNMNMKLPQSINRTLHKFVIRDSKDVPRGWEFQNMFVLEFTTLNITLLFVALFLWLVNRQTHMRPTKGSKIQRLQQRKDKKRKQKLLSIQNHLSNDDDNNDNDDDNDSTSSSTSSKDNDNDNDNDDDDDSDEEIDAMPQSTSLISSIRQQKQQQQQQQQQQHKVKRQSIRQTMLNQMAAVDTEKDDDDYDHGDHPYHQHSSDEKTETKPASNATMDPTTLTSSSSLFLDEIPLTRKKRGLLKILKQIKVFSYLDEEAMALCLEHVDFYTFQKGQPIFSKGEYDGSLYAVMNGSVQCKFHNYPIQHDDDEENDDDNDEDDDDDDDSDYDDEGNNENLNGKDYNNNENKVETEQQQKQQKHSNEENSTPTASNVDNHDNDKKATTTTTTTTTTATTVEPRPFQEEHDQSEEYQRVIGNIYYKGQVVTSILAMMAGMVHVMEMSTSSIPSSIPKQDHDTTSASSTHDDAAASTAASTTTTNLGQEESANNTTTQQQQQPPQPEYLQREKSSSSTSSKLQSSLFSIMPIAKEISAIALEKDTQIIRVSPACFAQVLERYPSNVYRIAQTALNRAQRLTVLTLVHTLGLRKELVVFRNPSATSTSTSYKSKTNSTTATAARRSSSSTNKNNSQSQTTKTTGIGIGSGTLATTSSMTWSQYLESYLNNCADASTTTTNVKQEEKERPLSKEQIQEQACIEFAKILGVPITVTSFNRPYTNNIHNPTTISHENDIRSSNNTTSTSSSSSSSPPLQLSESINILKEYSEIVHFPQGHVVLHTGDTHDFCYLLLSGTMEMGLQVPVASNSKKNKKSDKKNKRRASTTSTINNNKKNKRESQSQSNWQFQSCLTIQPGKTLIGEHTCFSGDLSLFHVKCSSDCTALKVPRHIYLHLIRRHPHAMAKSLKGLLQQVSSEVHLLNWTSEWMYVEAAEEIVRRGDSCDSMFVVLNGRLRAAMSSRQKRNDPRLQDLEYGRGKIVGEVGCLTRSKWQCNLYAIRNSEIVRVPMRTLLVIIGKFPTAGLHFARSIAGKVAEQFAGGTTTTATSMSAATTSINGTHNDMMTRTVPPTPFGSTTSGGIGRNISTGSTEWSTPLTSLSSSPSGIQSPNVMRSYGLRLATIAVVPLTDSVNIERFSSSLVSSFGEIAPCKLLTKQFIRVELGEKVYRNHNEMRKLRLTRLLADMEENHRLVVYQADQKYTWWTRLCIQQADCILLVVNAERAPSLKRVEQSLEWAHKSINVRIDLVVVGSPTTEEDDRDSDEDEDYYDDEEEEDGHGVDFEEMSVSDQLNNWSEQRKWISGHHLVRRPFRRYPMDFRRLSRRVSGRAVGLVLGAGGARGLAHVGVIKALKEAGVTIDLVGGTSQGAFVGALYARQPDDYDHCEESCRKMAKDMSSVKNKLFDLTLPMTSMFCGRLFNRGIRKRLGKYRIQDLVLNFFCVSVDLQKQQQVVHTKGILWKYVRASMTLTQYLPPVAENGTLLVDGGYMNTVPVDVMRQQMNPRLVIAVDVSEEVEREYYDYGTTLSGWWLLWNSWNPFAKTVQVPSMGDISDMLIWVSSERHRRNMKMESDLYLTPPVQGVGTLEYDRFDELVQSGYEYAKPLVAEFVRKYPWVVTTNNHHHHHLRSSITTTNATAASTGGASPTGGKTKL